jgi:RNA polymerase sigma-70 factor (ECF subfamily)
MGREAMGREVMSLPSPRTAGEFRALSNERLIAPRMVDSWGRARSGQAGGVDDLTRSTLAARDGDRAALARFVRESQADVWRLVAHLVDRGAADDLTQEVYERALKALPNFRGDSSARTWLLSIARRTCADAIRRRTRRRTREERLRDLAVDRSVTGGAHAVELDDVLERLDGDRRSAFVLTQLLGFSYAEAAQVCQCPVGTIRSRVARARADLVELWDPEEEGRPDGNADAVGT